MSWCLGLAASVLACGDSMGPAVSSDLVTARAVDGYLEVENRSDATVYTFVADRDLLPVLDWIPCVDPATCDGIEPGTVRRTALGQVLANDRRNAEIVVYHWRLVPATGGGTGYQPDSIRQLIVSVR